MKKSVILILTFLLIVLTACSSDDQAESKKGEKENKKDESIEVDKGLLSVEVTLPASMFEGEDIESTIAEAEEDGIAVKKNQDGSLTYKMSKSKHKQMIKEMKTDLLKSIDEMKTSGDYPSVQEITHNKSFSKFTLVVDKAAYENSFDGFAAFGLGISGMYYQLFKGVDSDNLKVKIFVKDAATAEVFNEIVYPDAFDDLEE